MRDDLNAQGGPDGREAARKAPETERLTDREVPLGQSHISAAVHAWLDGELPESAVRGESKRELEFWQRITAETAVRREVRTPPHVQAQIMAALPQTAPTMSPWWRRDLVVSPQVAITAAASLVALGAAASAVVIKAMK